MRIIDLTPENEKLFFLCLEDWSDEARESGNHKECWYRTFKEKGLRVKLAEDEKGDIGGMIQYVPIEQSTAEGSGFYFIQCIWVHGHKKGRGNFQKRGMGTALLQAAELDARERGARGMAAWGISLPFWMKASWFKKHGYKKADKQGIAVLLWKKFTEEGLPPRWIKPRKKPEKAEGKVTVTAFLSGWCLAQNLVFERAKRAAGLFPGQADFIHVDTSQRENFLEWGILDGLFIDDREVRTGPPPGFEKIKKLIARRVGKLSKPKMS